MTDSPCWNRPGADSQLKLTSDTDCNKIRLTLGCRINILMLCKPPLPKWSTFCSPSVQLSQPCTSVQYAHLWCTARCIYSTVSIIWYQKWLYRKWLLFSEPIIAIKHHYGYVNVRCGEGLFTSAGRSRMWGRMKSESQITERMERHRWSRWAPACCRGGGRGGGGGAYVRERVKWKRWRRPLKVRKECGGKLRMVISQ